MPEYYCYLVFLWCEEVDALIRCALKTNLHIDNFLDPAARTLVLSMLPDHVANCRRVVEIERIFEVHDTT